MTADDERCCGTGTCIIDAQGRCWCGQRWDGQKMCRPSLDEGMPTSEGSADPAARPLPSSIVPERP